MFFESTSYNRKVSLQTGDFSYAFQFNNLSQNSWIDCRFFESSGVSGQSTANSFTIKSGKVFAGTGGILTDSFYGNSPVNISGNSTSGRFDFYVEGTARILGEPLPYRRTNCVSLVNNRVDLGGIDFDLFFNGDAPEILIAPRSVFYNESLAFFDIPVINLTPAKTFDLLSGSLQPDLVFFEYSGTISGKDISTTGHLRFAQVFAPASGSAFDFTINVFTNFGIKQKQIRLEYISSSQLSVALLYLSEELQFELNSLTYAL